MDLCTHGPKYFCQFLAQIHNAKAIEDIPLTKTHLVPTHAMDINNSTVSGNIRALTDLLTQGGIYTPNDAAAVNVDKPNISVLSGVVSAPHLTSS